MTSECHLVYKSSLLGVFYAKHNLFCLKSDTQLMKCFHAWNDHAIKRIGFVIRLDLCCSPLVLFIQQGKITLPKLLPHRSAQSVEHTSVCCQTGAKMATINQGVSGQKAGTPLRGSLALTDNIVNYVACRQYKSMWTYANTPIPMGGQRSQEFWINVF